MAATFGAATQATFTAIVFVFELTRDYDVILPLMLATVIADLVYSAVNEDSLMTEKLRRRGLNIGRHYGVDPFSSTRVRDIMTTDPGVLAQTSLVEGEDEQVLTLKPADLALQALQIMLDEAVDALPVVEGGEIVGVCTRNDLFKVRRKQLELEQLQPGLRARLLNRARTP
jgi:CBS domain-containing protein